MKRATSLLIIFFLLYSLSGCAEDGNVFYLTAPKDETTKIINNTTNNKTSTAAVTEPISTATESAKSTDAVITTQTQSEPESTEKTEANPIFSDEDIVYWLKDGTVYHLFCDCTYLKDTKNEIISGTHKDCGREKLCSRCSNKAKATN